MAKQLSSHPTKTLEPEIAKLNARHFVVSVAGKTRVGTDLDMEGQPYPLELSTFHDFRERYQNKWVQTDEKPIRLGTYWLNYPDRRQYEKRGAIQCIFVSIQLPQLWPTVPEAGGLPTS